MVLTHLTVYLEALEIALHDEVDDAGNGVGAVGRGCAAGEHFDVVDEPAGIWSRSGAGFAMPVFGAPMPSRRPSMSTSVRPGPSPRRSAVATPPAVVRPDVPLPKSWPRSFVNTCGSWLMMSVMSVFPDTWMDFDETTWIGLVLTSFGEAMRDPVTMISFKVWRFALRGRPALRRRRYILGQQIGIRGHVHHVRQWRPSRSGVARRG